MTLKISWEIPYIWGTNFKIENQTYIPKIGEVLYQTYIPKLGELVNKP